MKNLSSDTMLELLRETVSLYSPPQTEQQVAEYLVAQANRLGWQSYRGDEAGNFGSRSAAAAARSFIF